MPFTEAQHELVQRSWNAMKGDSESIGLKLFIRIFEIAPEAKRFFPFVHDAGNVPLLNNAKLKAHARAVFVMGCEYVTQLRNTGDGSVIMQATLKRLGPIHAKAGVTYTYFEVIKVALLDTIKESVPDMWTPEMKAAWEEAYDQLVAAMMKAARKA